GSKSKIVMRPLVLFPHMRNDHMHRAAALQHSFKLLYDTSRLRRVLEHDDRENAIEGFARKREFLEPPNHVQFRIIPSRVPLRKIKSHVGCMSEVRAKAAFAGAGIQHVDA